MLMEFETLDALDVGAIMDGSWSAEKKRARLKAADELQKKVPPPAPGQTPPVSVKPSSQPDVQLG